MSLIQVMVAAGIMSIIAVAVTSMISDQNKSAKAMTEKLLLNDLQSQMKSLFENKEYCNCAFRNAGGPRTFDMTQPSSLRIVAADQFTSLAGGYSVPSPTCTVSGNTFIPAANTTVPGSLTMRVNAIELGPLTLVSTGVYKADLTVSFRNTIHSMNPIRTSILFSIDMAGGAGNSARPFANCGSAALGQIPTGNYIFMPSQGGGGGGDGNFRCPDGRPFIGITGRSGVFLDGIGVLCGNNYTPIGVGGGGGGPFSDTCPPGKVVSGLKGRAGAKIDGIQMYCSNPDGTNSVLSGSYHGGGGGGVFDTPCPANSVMTEFRFRAGAAVDAVQAVCQNLN